MPLIDLKTNLKSLKYGLDRRGGGNSGQPYMQFPIDDANASSRIRTLYERNRNSLDFPIRGGVLLQNPLIQYATSAGEIDRERISKFLKDNPRGPIFLAKQVGLNLSNPKIETGRTLVQNGILPGAIENTRVYNPLGTNSLTQIALSGTGAHFPRQGMTPIDLNARYYAKTVGAQLQMGSDEVANVNRLLILQQLKLLKNPPGANINRINELGISTNGNALFNYIGGPGSAYGIGNTLIKRYDDTTEAFRKVKSSGAKSYAEIAASNINITIAGERTTTIISSEGNQTREQIYNLTTKTQIDKVFGSINQDGTLTQTPYFSIAKGEDPWVDTKASKDLIKFGFECMSNDDPGSSVFLQFRAFLNGAITDNHQAELNGFRYIGRGEEFFTYQGFNRSIGFSFRVAVQHKQEIKSLYNKLNYLISQIYPDYSEKGIMRGSIVKVTIGDYLYRVPGFLESVNLSINQDSSWEIDIKKKEDSLNPPPSLPHYIDVNISFKPIMEELPRRFSKIRSEGDNIFTDIKGAAFIANRDNIIDRSNKQGREFGDSIRRDLLSQPNTDIDRAFEESSNISFLRNAIRNNNAI